MAGFSIFNQTTTTTTPFATPNLNTTPAFGATPSQQNVSFGSTPAPSFEAASTSNTSGFGMLKSQFGSPNTSMFGSPNTAATQTGLTFGTNVQSSGLSQTQPKPAFGTLSFGAASTTPSFGATPAPAQTNISFGTPATTSQTGIAFGTPSNTTAAPQTSLTFGTLTSAAVTAPQTSISFGGIQSVPSQRPAFGVPATATTQAGLSFALPASTSTATLTLTPSLGITAPSTTTQGISFGVASTSQPTLSFGTGPSLPTSQPTLSFGTGPSLSTAATTTASSLFPSLGSSIPTPASSAPSLFANLTSTATSSSITPSGGIFSWQKPASDSGTTVSSDTTSIGLGGVDHSAVTATQSSTNTVTSAKEQPLPNEIQQTVVAFKEYVKTQKNLSSEVARSSAEPLTKLTQQISALNNLIINLGSVLTQHKFTAERIKLETIKSLNDYELAQKIKDSPVASEERLLSIRKYFTEKISGFEESTKVLQQKIEYVFQHVSTLPQENSLSAEALKLIVKKLHDSFVVIGARTYKLHNDMQLLKVHYMTLRNQYVKDNSSISLSLNRELQLPTEARAKSSDLALEGPNPFSRTGNGSFNSLLLTSQNRSFAASASGGVAGLLNTSKTFGFSDHSGSSLFDQSTSPGLGSSQQFNLQKPPLGNKRGKR